MEPGILAMKTQICPHAAALTVLLALGGALGSCGDDEPTPSNATGGVQPSPQTLFGPQITQIQIEVDYMPQAEPFVGSAGAINDVWRLFGDNAQRMFAAASPAKTITFPNELSQMQALDDVQGDFFSSSAILDIAQRHRDAQNTDSRATFYVVWLDGFFQSQDGQTRRDVLGVSIGDTGVIAMFKPVIDGAGTPALPGIARFVEQTTLIHEFGHAAGLVNRGVPLQSEHHDEENGAHCTNRDCVMFFANEGVADLRDFVTEFIASGDTVVFGDLCLEDMDALIER